MLDLIFSVEDNDSYRSMSVAIHWVVVVGGGVCACGGGGASVHLRAPVQLINIGQLTPLRRQVPDLTNANLVQS